MIDILRLQYNHCDIRISDNIALKPLTLGEIAELGYEQYNTLLQSLISNSKDIADILWFEFKVWYEDIEDDWEFFIQKSCDVNKTSYIKYNHKLHECIYINEIVNQALNLFLRTDLNYVLTFNESDDEYEIIGLQKHKYGAIAQWVYTHIPLIHKMARYDNAKITDICITKNVYKTLIQTLKQIHWIKDDYMFVHGGTRRAKIYILQQQYRSRKKAQNNVVTIYSIVSALIAKNISYSEIWNMSIYMIYDLYYRLLKIDEWDNTMNALHSGCLDTKKNPIDWEKINWASIIKL